MRLLARAVGSRLQRNFDRNSIEKILILQLQMVGDSVAFTPTLRAIRGIFPSARIDLLCSPISAQFYRKCRHIENVFVDRWFHSHGSDVLGHLRFIRAIRDEHYDLAIADASETSAIYGVIAYATAARHRIGFSIDNRGFLYTRPLRPSLRSNFIDDNLAIATSLGVNAPAREVECYFDEADDAYARALLARHHVHQPLVAMHVMSNWQSKTWFPERWATVADALVDRCGAQIIFVGTNRERPYIEKVRVLMHHESASVAGETDLAQLSALLSHCALFVGTDSGPRHIAAAAQRPQITLMSSQDFRERWDFGRDSEVILRTDPPCSPCFQSFCAHRRCMDEISVETVLAACQRLIERGHDHRRGCEPVPSTSPIFADFDSSAGCN